MRLAKGIGWERFREVGWHMQRPCDGKEGWQYQEMVAQGI